MYRSLIAPLALLAFVASMALADEPAQVDRGRGCYRWTMCANEPNTGACAGTTAIVQAGGVVTHAAVSTCGTTATAHVCDVYTSGIGYDASKRKKATSVSLSGTNCVVPLDGALPDAWVECTTITHADPNAPAADGVTAYLYGCYPNPVD